MTCNSIDIIIMTTHKNFMNNYDKYYVGCQKCNGHMIINITTGYSQLTIMILHMYTQYVYERKRERFTL